MLKDGQVYRDGSKPEVLTSAVLSDAFGVSVEVERREGFYGAW